MYVVFTALFFNSCKSSFCIVYVWYVFYCFFNFHCFVILLFTLNPSDKVRITGLVCKDICTMFKPCSVLHCFRHGVIFSLNYLFKLTNKILRASVTGGGGEISASELKGGRNESLTRTQKSIQNFVDLCKKSLISPYTSSQMLPLRGYPWYCHLAWPS